MRRQDDTSLLGQVRKLQTIVNKQKDHIETLRSQLTLLRDAQVRLKERFTIDDVTHKPIQSKWGRKLGSIYKGR